MICTGCGEDKPPELFRLRKSRSTGEHYRGKKCQRCHQAKSDEWRKANPDRIGEYNKRSRAKPGAKERAIKTAMDRHYRVNYGISEADKIKLLLEQGGNCAICFTMDPGRRGWALDHCHDTGKVRGVLCGPCNAGLGLLKDNIKVLQRAIEYLEKHK